MISLLKVVVAIAAVTVVPALITLFLVRKHYSHEVQLNPVVMTETSSSTEGVLVLGGRYNDATTIAIQETMMQ